MEFKANSKITVYYFGSAEDTLYKGVTTTVKTFRNWKERRDKKSKDIAFILEGTHKALNGYKLEKYIQENRLRQLSKWDF